MCMGCVTHFLLCSVCSHAVVKRGESMAFRSKDHQYCTHASLGHVEDSGTYPLRLKGEKATYSNHNHTSVACRKIWGYVTHIFILLCSMQWRGEKMQQSISKDHWHCTFLWGTWERVWPTAWGRRKDKKATTNNHNHAHASQCHQKMSGCVTHFLLCSIHVFPAVRRRQQDSIYSDCFMTLHAHINGECGTHPLRWEEGNNSNIRRMYYMVVYIYTV